MWRWGARGEGGGHLRVGGEWLRLSRWSWGIIRGTRGLSCTQELSSHRLGPSPLLGALEAVDLGEHICDLILQLLWTHMQGLAWRSGCPRSSRSARGSGLSLRALLNPLGSFPSYAFSP